ncbi:MAG: hypothetical protein HY941_04440 [Gammaproteobacteria bacterium]|nr:hypothetical protein [Gammaproteobacteria bacterium]
MQNQAVKSGLVGIVVWLLVCTVGGFVVLAQLRDYGSILQPVVGMAMGFLGAGTHALLCFSGRFRALGFLRRAFLNWLTAYLLFTALAILLTNFGAARFNPDFWPEFFRFMVLYTGGPMLLVAVLVALVTGIERLRA